MKTYLSILFVFLFITVGKAQLSADYLFGDGRTTVKQFPLVIDDSVQAQIWFNPLVVTKLAQNFLSENYSKEENYAVSHPDSLTIPANFPLTFKDRMHGDTLFVNLLSLPITSFDSLSDLNSLLDSLLSVPVYIKSQAFREKLNLKEWSIRIPFPDSLIPQTKYVTYPDSADLVVKLNYEKLDTLKIDSDNFNAVKSRISLSLFLRAKVKPIIGAEFVFSIPLFDEYGMDITYAGDGIGFAGFSADSVQVSIPYSSVGGENQTLFRIPKIEMSVNVIFATSIKTEQKLKPEAINVSAYPNPFNPSTTISIQVNKFSSLRIEMVNILGQKIKTIQPESDFLMGDYLFQLDASTMASGVYFVVIQGVEKNSNGIIKQIIPISLVK